MKLLNEYGRQMMTYRLSDKSPNGEIRGLGLFKSDISELNKFIKRAPLTHAPLRVVFGLPLNFKIDGKKIIVNCKQHPKRARRASPLFAHLHEFPDGQRTMLATLFPAQFLPSHEGVDIRQDKYSLNIPFKPDWKVIEAFIQQCEGKELTV